MSRVRALLGMRGWVYLWAAFVVPLIYGASFPSTPLPWLAWIGFVPWFVAIRVARTRAALVICCVSTLLGSYFCTPWLAHAVANYYQQPLFVGLMLFAGVYAFSVGPYVIACTLVYRRLARSPTAWLPLLTGMTWAGAEVARARLLAGNPFGIFGYSQLEITALVQIADVTGVYGITVITMAVSAALAEVWLAYGHVSQPAKPESVWVSQPPTTAQAWRGVALVAAALVAVTGYGALRLQSFGESNTQTPTRIAIVQANLDLGSQWRQEFYGRNLDTYVRLTVEALRDDKPQLVFWPESAMTFFLEDEPTYRAALGYMLSPTQTQLVTGGPRQISQSPPHYYNSGFLVAPTGDIVATYDKQQLLPFAEYFPFGGIELLRRQFARVREFTPGGAARLLPTVAGPAGVLICNEAMFGEMVSNRVRAGAQYLVTLANDSWLGDRKYAEEAFDMARLRAVEQRRYLVRASTSGPSAIVDPLGRVLTRTAADSRATLGGSVSAATTLTFYARYGDAFGVLCVVIPLGVILARRVAALHRGHVAMPAYPDERATNGTA
ncbi:MAG TPA: apolipoprotein N-acyltransferase [Candidatus Kryptonia bacterium]|nr:apolipoprotein N-acyltransferase [Candidatus Kryptonia bacterium]